MTIKWLRRLVIAATFAQFLICGFSIGFLFTVVGRVGLYLKLVGMKPTIGFNLGFEAGGLGLRWLLLVLFKKAFTLRNIGAYVIFLLVFILINAIMYTMFVFYEEVETGKKN